MRIPLWITRGLLAAALTGLVATCLPAQPRPVSDEPTPPAASAGLLYRRVLVPEDRLAELARGYMPLKRDEFARHLAQIRAGAETSESSAARLSQAVYYARLQDLQFVAGQARLAVTLDAAGPALLSLAPCGLAVRTNDMTKIGRPEFGPPEIGPPGVRVPVQGAADQRPIEAWRPDFLFPEFSLPDDGQLADGQLANGSAGYTPLGVGADRQLWALVDRSGYVDFEWTLAGKPYEAAGGRFELQLPSAPSSRLWLDIPGFLKLSCEVGLVTASPDEAIHSPTGPTPTGPTPTGPTPAGMPKSVAAGHRRWLVELGGHSAASLIVVPEDVIPSGRRAIRLRQEAAYELSPAGIELSTDFHLDIPLQPLQRLTFLADRTLQVTSVQFRGQEVSWTSYPDERERWQRVVVEFAEPIAGPDCVVRVQAIGPMVLGRSQRLPTLRATGVLWQEGTARLNISNELIIRQLTPQGCREAPADSPLLPNPARQRTFHCYVPTASLVALIDSRNAVVTADSGVRLWLGEEEVRADLSARLTGAQGEVFRLESYLPAAWQLDGLQLEPPDALASYELQPVRGDATRGQSLVVRLNQAITGQRSMTVRMQVRMNARPDQAITPADYRAWHFTGARMRRQIVAVETTPRHRLRLAHDLELSRQDPSKLTEGDVVLLGPINAQSLIFVDDGSADELTIRRERIDPEFAVAIAMTATLGSQELQEVHRIACEPRSGALQRLQVQFSALREKPPQWSLEGPEDIVLTATPQGPIVDESGRRTGETWQLELNRALTEKFVLVARRGCPLAAEQPLALASVPAAASQSGELDIHTTNGACVRIDQQQLTMLPPAPLPWDRYSPSRARLRYEPGRNGQVRVTRSPESTPNHALWAWSYDLTSRFSGHGEALHRVILRLENTGATQLLVKIPKGIQLRRARAEGQQFSRDIPVAGDREQAGDRELLVPLPVGERFPRVELEYVTATAALSGWTQLAALAPEPDCPVLERRWRVWLPARYAIWPASWPRDWPAYEEPDWLTRYFGLFTANNVANSLPLPAELASLVGPAVADSWAVQTLFRSLEAGLVPAPDQPDNLNWADVLRQCAGSLAKGGFQLRVDETAMREIDVRPQARPTSPRGNKDRLDARSLLSRHGLLVLVGERVVVLTSVTMLPEFRREVQPSNDPQVVRLRDHGRLVHQLEADSNHRGRFLDVVAWATAPPVETPTWSEAELADRSSMDAAGWTVSELPFADHRDLQCRVVLAEMPRAGGWVVMLATTGLLFWVCRRRRTRSVLFMGVAAALAAVAPPLLIPVSSGALIGSLAAGLAVLVWPRSAASVRPPGRVPWAPSSLSRRVPAAVLLLAALLLAAFAAGLHGQSRNEPASSTAAIAPAYRVLIPVDKNRQPVGEHDYLPLPFYEALLRRSIAAVASPKGWLIESAEYRGSLNLEAGETEEPLSEITATFKLRTFEAEQQVRLDLQRRHLELLAARLDGTTIQLTWDPDGGFLRVPVPRAGSHELQLTIRSFVRQFDLHRGFEIGVPRLSDARLELQVFGELPRVEVPGALGAVSHEGNPHVLTAELGPTERLRVQWAPEVTEQVPMDVTADELLWLKIKPHSVVVDAQFRLTARSGSLDQVTLRADPRLRLLRVDPPLAGRPIVRGGERPTLQMKLAAPAGKELVLRVSLILEDSSGVGNIGVPDLSVVADRTRRRWLGVSVAPALQLTTANIPPASLLDPAEFSTAWGGEPEPPDLALGMNAAPLGGTLATRFHEAQTTAAQRTRVRVGRESLHVRFEADLACSAGLGYLRQIQIPADLEVQQVLLRTEGEPLPLEFVPGDARNLTVLFGPRDVTSAGLILTGRIPVRRRSRLQLPLIQLQNAEVLSNQIEVYRQPSAVVTLEQIQALVPETQEESDGAYVANWGRLVARLVQPADAGGLPAPAGVLRIEPNLPRTKARLVTRLRRDNGSWVAEIDYRVQAEHGLLDALRLEIPAEWSGPLEFDEVVPYVVRTSPGDNRRNLTLFPARAFTGEFAVRVRGRLSNSPNETDGVPDFVPLDVETVERYLVVPKKLDEKPVEWIPSGLQAVGLPELQDNESQDEWAAYRIMGPRPQVTIRQGKSTVDVARVRLADLLLARRSSGHCLGVATFDLQPADQPSVTLQLPAPYQLVHVRTDGQPTFVSGTAPGQWRIQLGSDRLPQRIEVIFRGQLPAEADRGDAWTLPAPTLVDLPVEQTAWTIRRDDSGRPYLPRDASGVDSTLRQDTIRLQNLAALIESTGVVLGDRVQQDVDLWYALWSARLAGMMHRVSQESWLATLDEQHDPLLVEQLRGKQQQLAGRLKTASLWERSQTQPPRLVSAAEVWSQAARWPVATTRWTLAGTADSAVVKRPLEPRVGSDSRWALVLGWLGLGLLVHRGVSRGVLQSLIAPWPHVWGVLLGLAWWFLLWPAFVGWIIVLVSLLSALRQPWKAVAQSSSASTIIRRESVVRRRTPQA